eukprot:5825168-Prymnesium_polylepis.1
MVLSVARARACTVRVRVWLHFWERDISGTASCCASLTPQSHASYMPPCDCGVHSHNSEPFSRNRAPREVTSRFVGFV